MRTKIIAGNWKMYKDLAGTTELIAGLTSRIAASPARATVVVCPPFTSLALASTLLKGSPVRLGAQNMSQHDEGAFTGEISWNMLRAAGCEYVILGHSERRQYYGEKDELINAKAKKAIASSLRPIICVGETLAEREQGITDRVVSTQIRGVLSGLSRSDMSSVVVAYEPVWAIGTGKTATPAQAQEVHQMIRKLISQLYDWPTADATVIQYGGSVKPDNAAELLSQNDIDGALVGGACLKPDSFMSIISAAK
ncbi:MAG TPA: triose-phosphate isomerase [Bacteroidota bacterium]|nr:triose-phosphate isomerase [Bacteroidota bacterium]